MPEYQKSTGRFQSSPLRDFLLFAHKGYNDLVREKEEETRRDIENRRYIDEYTKAQINPNNDFNTRLQRSIEADKWAETKYGKGNFRTRLLQQETFSIFESVERSRMTSLEKNLKTQQNFTLIDIGKEVIKDISIGQNSLSMDDFINEIPKSNEDKMLFYNKYIEPNVPEEFKINNDYYNINKTNFISQLDNYLADAFVDKNLEIAKRGKEIYSIDGTIIRREPENVIANLYKNLEKYEKELEGNKEFKKSVQKYVDQFLRQTEREERKERVGDKVQREFALSHFENEVKEHFRNGGTIEEIENLPAAIELQLMGSEWVHKGSLLLKKIIHPDVIKITNYENLILTGKGNKADYEDMIDSSSILTYAEKQKRKAKVRKIYSNISNKVNSFAGANYEKLNKLQGIFPAEELAERAKILTDVQDNTKRLIYNNSLNDIPFLQSLFQEDDKEIQHRVHDRILNVKKNIDDIDKDYAQRYDMKIGAKDVLGFVTREQDLKYELDNLDKIEPEEGYRKYRYGILRKKLEKTQKERELAERKNFLERTKRKGIPFFLPFTFPPSKIRSVILPEDTIEVTRKEVEKEVPEEEKAPSLLYTIKK